MNGITFPIHLYSEQAKHQTPLLSGTPKILTQSGAQKPNGNHQEERLQLYNPLNKTIEPAAELLKRVEQFLFQWLHFISSSE